MLDQTDDSVYGSLDPSQALKPPVPAAQSTAALRPAPPDAQARAALTPPAKVAAPVVKQEQGEDPLAVYYQKVRAHESGGNDAASSGVAYGRYQFTPQTWLAVAIKHPELGLDKANILDGAKQDAAMRALTQDNAAVLQKNGIEVTPQNLFMLHFLGEGGGPKFLREMQANPSANAAALFPLETRYNPTIFNKPDGQPRTLAEVYGLMTKSFGGAAPTPDPGFKMEIAEGPAMTMTDASSAPEPPPPPGSVPLAAAEEPPPPPGSVPIAGADNPYAVKPAPAGEAPKPSTPQEGTIVGRDPLGNPIYAEPQSKEEVDVDKGVLAGAARDFTGPGSVLLPGAAGQKAQDWTNELNKTGSPEARALGGLLPFTAIAGPALGALQPSVAAALTGLGFGLDTGTQGTSDKTTALGRLNEKLPTMLEEGIGGGALGGLMPGLTSLAGKAKDEIGSLAKTITGGYGREAERAAEELRTGVSAETGKALTAEERKVAEKAAAEGGAKTKLAAHEAEIQRIEEAQARLKLRDEIRAAEGRDARQSLDPEAAARLKAQVVQRVRDRVFEAEKAAKKAGLNADEARAFAADQEKARLAAEEDAANLVEQFRNRMPTTPEELGDQIREAALKDMREQRAVRERDSGFAKAVNSDKGQPSIPTKQFVQKIAEAERRAVSPGAQSTLAWLRGELKTAQPGGSITAVSIQRARRIVQALDSRIEGLPLDEAHEITALKDAFVKHIEDVHPQMRVAREEYARLSRPLDVYERTGALKKSVQSDPYSGDAVVDSTKIAGALLNKSENGADALSRLVARDPKMLDSVRGYFNQQLFGAGKSVTPQAFERFLYDNRVALERVGLGDLKDVQTAERLFAPRGPNAIEFRGKTYDGNTRLEAIQAAHKETGIDLERISNESNDNAARATASTPTSPSRGPLAQEFERLRDQFGAKQEGVAQAKIGEAAAAEQAKFAEQARKSALDKVSDERGLLDKAKKREADAVKATEKAAPAPADAAAAKAKADEARLKEAARGPSEAARSTEQDVSRLAAERTRAETARRDFKEFQSALDTAAPREAATTASSAIEKLHKSGYLTDAQLDEFNRQIREVRDKYKDSDEALHTLRYRIWPAVAAAAGAAGIGGVTEYFSHRIRP